MAELRNLPGLMQHSYNCACIKDRSIELALRVACTRFSARWMGASRLSEGSKTWWA